MFKVEETSNYLIYIQTAYEADPDLITKWHVIAGSSLNKCVDRTVADLASFDRLKFYVVHEDGKFSGYFGTEFNGAFLSTLFVMPNFRKKKDEFWAEIEYKVTKKFWAGIFSKNTPCMRFYAKHGKVEVKGMMPDGEVTVFEFERAGN